MAVTDPALCKRVALRYAALMFPLCFLCPYLDITTWNFAYTSSAVNAFMVGATARLCQHRTMGEALASLFTPFSPRTPFLCIVIMY